MKNILKDTKAFTLVEILVVTVVLSLFLGGVYAIFGGSQRIAGKSSWLQYTIDRLRFTQAAIFKAVKTSSYPSTILPSNLYDAGGTEELPGTFASNYFIRIAPGLGKFSAKEILGKNKGVFLITSRSEAEVTGFQEVSENKSGTIVWNVFSLRPSPNSEELGIIYMEEKTQNFNTLAPDYAKSLDRSHSGAKHRVTFKLAEDVEWIEFQATPGYSPNEIAITISARYYREKSLTRQSIIKTLPNVGIKVGL